MTAKSKKDSSFFEMDNFQRIEQPNFTVLRNPVPLPALALTFPQ